MNLGTAAASRELQAILDSSLPDLLTECLDTHLLELLRLSLAPQVEHACPSTDHAVDCEWSVCEGVSVHE